MVHTLTDPSRWLGTEEKKIKYIQMLQIHRAGSDCFYGYLMVTLERATCTACWIACKVTHPGWMGRLEMKRCRDSRFSQKLVSSSSFLLSSSNTSTQFHGSRLHARPQITHVLIYLVSFFLCLTSVWTISSLLCPFRGMSLKASVEQLFLVNW